MDDDRENLARFSHLLSSPMTALRGAIDLLRRPRRMAADPLTRELLEALERNCARLRAVIDTLLEHSQVGDGQLLIVVPLVALVSLPGPPAAAALTTLAELAPAHAPPRAAGERPPAGGDPTRTVLLVED